MGKELLRRQAKEMQSKFGGQLLHSMEIELARREDYLSATANDDSASEHQLLVQTDCFCKILSDIKDGDML